MTAVASSNSFLLAALPRPGESAAAATTAAGCVRASLKLSDFGLAAKWTGQPLTDVTGSPYYIAPEVLKGAYGPEADTWSCGVVLYTMLTSHYPFAGASVQDIFASGEGGK